MSSKKTPGDITSKAPRHTADGWLNHIDRRRKAGPFLSDRSAPGRGMSTLSVHTGTHDASRTGAAGSPIYQASTIVLNESQYRSVEDGFARNRFIYWRHTTRRNGPCLPMGNNQGPNPRKLLPPGPVSCMMVSIIAGATAEGIQLKPARIDFDATPEQFAELHRKSLAHSPNAQTTLNPVGLNGEIASPQIES